MSSSSEVAQTQNHDEPSGIGGWLLLPIASIFLSIYEVLREFYGTSMVLLGPEMWAAFTTQGTYFYHLPWVFVIVFGALLQVLMMIAGGVALLAILKKMKIAVHLMIGIYIMGVCLAVLGVLLAYFFIPMVVPDIADESFSDAIKKMAVMSIVAIVWTLYFLKSDRVKNTFKN